MARNWTPRSDEEKDAERQALHQKIEGEIERLAALTDAAAANAQLQLVLATMAKFHHYSFNNVVLILLQKPDATRVAGFSTWKDLGRWPHKGTGLKIWAPTKKTIEDEDGEKHEILVGYHVTTVFDVSDTEGKPLPDPRPLWVVSDPGGDELYAGLLDLARRSGIPVAVADTGPAMGESWQDRIHISPNAQGIGRASTLVHELAHIWLEHFTRPEITRELAELEAEAVAFVVCSCWGLPTKSANYIALWKGDSKAVIERMDSIQKVARRIVDGLGEAQDREEQAA